MQKTHMRGRDTKHQSIFINVEIIVYNDSLKHGDPNESLARPKQGTFKLSPVSCIVLLDNIKIHRRRQLFIIQVYE